MQVNTTHSVRYALVTGGSEGIGRAIAGALAERGFGLLLVALPGEALTESGDYLSSKFNCPVHVFPEDLCDNEADKRIYNWVIENNFRVSVLVNNAGFGSLGPFSSFDRDRYNQMLHVNIVNVVGLTRLMLEMIRSHPAGHILNVGSIASFFPIPYKTVYSSSKYFVYAFSRALREEMRGSKVKVSLLCPGPVNTNADVKARIACAGYFGRKTALEPERVGELAVRRMLRGGWLILPGFPAKFLFYLEKVIPTTLKQRMLAWKFRKGNV